MGPCAIKQIKPYRGRTHSSHNINTQTGSERVGAGAQESGGGGASKKAGRSQVPAARDAGVWCNRQGLEIRAFFRWAWVAGRKNDVFKPAQGGAGPF